MALISNRNSYWTTNGTSDSSTQFYVNTVNTSSTSANSTFAVPPSSQTHLTIAVPPGAQQVHIPIYAPLSAYPDQCKHENFNMKYLKCLHCDQTAEEIAKKHKFKPPKIPRMPEPRAFNRYINGSDLMEEFIEYLGKEGVKKSEWKDLPVELFVKWMVIRACEEDQEEAPVQLQIPAPKGKPRCLGCGQFMKVEPIMLHPKCGVKYYGRIANNLQMV